MGKQGAAHQEAILLCGAGSTPAWSQRPGGQWTEGRPTTVTVALGPVHGHLHSKWSPGPLHGSLTGQWGGKKRGQLTGPIPPLTGWALEPLWFSFLIWGVVLPCRADRKWGPMGSGTWSLHHDVQNIRSSKKGEFLPSTCSHLPMEEKDSKFSRLAGCGRCLQTEQGPAAGLQSQAEELLSDGKTGPGRVGCMGGGGRSQREAPPRHKPFPHHQHSLGPEAGTGMLS